MLESLNHSAVTREAGFDYGASGRGGWDEIPADVERLRKRPKKKRIAGNSSFYLSRAEMYGRCVADISGMTCNPHDYEQSYCGGVYLIANVVTRDFYIGCSAYLVRRWKSHIFDLRRRKHPIPKMNRLARRHGLKSFRFLVLQDGLIGVWQDKRLAAEEKWIKALRPTINRPRSKYRRY